MGAPTPVLYIGMEGAEDDLDGQWAQHSVNGLRQTVEVGMVNHACLSIQSDLVASG